MDEDKIAISFIIPVIRPESAEICMIEIARQAEEEGIDFEVLSEVDHERIGCPKMVAKLAEKSQYDYVCFVGDDTLPQEGWLHAAIRAMKFLPEGWGLVSFNDNPNSARTCAHWLASKKLLPFLDGEFFHTGYKHCFCDNELMIRCQMMNRYIYAYDAKLLHDHYIFTEDKQPRNAAEVELQEKIYSPKGSYAEDHALFQKRMANNWKTPENSASEMPQDKRSPAKLMIGIPSGDMWHAKFGMAMINIIIRTMSAGLQVVIVNQQSSIIECGRNSMVQTALAHGADYLFTIDSDMVPEPDTIIRMMQRKVDIVCADAARRRYPFTSVVQGKNGELLKPGQGLVEVDRTTSACMLVTAKVLKKVVPPHYAVTWDPVIPTKFTGEDYHFSKQCLRAGFTQYCDTDLRVGHIGEDVYYVGDDEKKGKAHAS